MKDIRHRVGIAAATDDIFEALTEPDRLVRWWAATARRETEPAPRLVLGFPGSRDLVWDIAEAEFGRRLHLRLRSGPDEWSGSALLFDLAEADDQVFVTLTHRTTDETPAEAWQFFCTKWPLFLVSLKDFLETGSGRPYPDDVRIQH